MVDAPRASWPFSQAGHMRKTFLNFPFATLAGSARPAAGFALADHFLRMRMAFLRELFSASDQPLHRVELSLQIGEAVIACESMSIIRYSAHSQFGLVPNMVKYLGHTRRGETSLSIATIAQAVPESFGRACAFIKTTFADPGCSVLSRNLDTWSPDRCHQSGVLCANITICL
jgi:hypothetical protein